MPAGLALSPKFVPRAAEENSLPRPSRLGERLFIHEPEHQHLPRGMLLNNRRHQPIALFKCNLHRPASKTAPENKKPAGLFCASGPMGALLNELLYAPQQTRRYAVMMMVSMRERSERRVHVRKSTIRNLVQPVNV